MSAEQLASGIACAPTRGYRFAKRALDVSVAAVALIVLIPLMFCVAFAITAGSRGAPLFRQRRVGRFGREFRMWKFRTMVSDAEQLRAELMPRSRERDWLHLDQDPRVTRVGRFLRCTSLDELPQLLNVLRGEMSLVGPRPLPLVEHAALPGWSLPRLEVQPGLTGLWQVGGRTQLGFLDMLQLDCRYVREQSLRADLNILIRTIPAVISARGAG
jgi:lipopolysaccharide/colanic/teichoic acid biosynthesis glycosyltransferase